METHLQTIILIILLIERFITYKVQRGQKRKHQQAKEEVFCLKEKQVFKESKNTVKPKKEITKKAISKQYKTSYEKLFLKNNNLVARNGKSIYIQPELHERLFRITRVIAGSNISVSNYLDNILRHHFTEFETEIKKTVKDKYKPIF